jgi:uncharacterized protein
MRIDLTNIPSEGKKLNLRLTPDWWKSDLDEDRLMGLEAPLSASIKLYPAGKKIAVEGSLSTRLVLRCDRCLEPYGWDLSTDFRIYLSISPFKGELDIELSEDDLSLDFINGEFLDPDQILREQIILNVPMKTLCRKDCKGLCPVCGCNLNMTRCSCPSTYETSVYQNS